MHQFVLEATKGYNLNFIVNFLYELADDFIINKTVDKRSHSIAHNDDVQQTYFFENNGIIFHPEIGNIFVPLARMRVGVPLVFEERVTSGPQLIIVTGPGVQGEHAGVWVTPRPSPGAGDTPCGHQHPMLGGDHVTDGHMMRCQLTWGITITSVSLIRL